MVGVEDRFCVLNVKVIRAFFGIGKIQQAIDEGPERRSFMRTRGEGGKTGYFGFKLSLDCRREFP